LLALGQDWSACFGQNARGATAGANPEFVHQARVASRRLRALLDLMMARGFATPRRVTRRTREEIRWAARTLGEARDLDVLRAEVLPSLRGPVPAQHLRALSAIVVKAQAAARLRVKTLVEDARFAALCVTLEETFRTPDDSHDAPTASTRELARMAASRIDRRWKRCLANTGSPERMAPEAIHRLRIQAKKLRYLIDMIAPGNRTATCKDGLARLADVQRQLGGYQDLGTARDLLRRLVGNDTPGHRDAREAADDCLARRQTQAHVTAVAAIRQLRHIEPFWRDAK
jgi:CHAD domain-containing protein